jgi:hypothetical protein
MDFKQAALLGNFLSKDYAKDFFRLLVNYQDISASEAASRLGLHVRTAQDFLEAMTELEILAKEEVYEKKRPYFRYRMQTRNIRMDIDLSKIEQQHTPTSLARHIREKSKAHASFSLARNGEYISHVSLRSGTGRDRKDRRISLTRPQGMFLYHLPFPNAEPLSIIEIMNKSDVSEELAPEILDIVELLETYDVLETQD